jgi:hypothetical protein
MRTYRVILVIESPDGVMCTSDIRTLDTGNEEEVLRTVLSILTGTDMSPENVVEVLFVDHGLNIHTYRPKE